MSQDQVCDVEERVMDIEEENNSESVTHSNLVNLDEMSSDDGFNENDPEFLRAKAIKQGDEKTDHFFLNFLKPAGFGRERQAKNGECAVSCVSSLRFQRYCFIY